MSLRWFIVIVGVAAVLTGLILGTVEVTAGPSSTSCGTAFSPNDTAARFEDMRREGGTLPQSIGGARIPAFPGQESDVVGECARAMGSRPAIVWVLLGGGAVLAAGGLVVRGARS